MSEMRCRLSTARHQTLSLRMTHAPCVRHQRQRQQRQGQGHSAIRATASHQHQCARESLLPPSSFRAEAEADLPAAAPPLPLVVSAYASNSAAGIQSTAASDSIPATALSSDLLPPARALCLMSSPHPANAAPIYIALCKARQPPETR